MTPATTTTHCTIRTANPGDLGVMVGLLGQLFSIEQDFEFDAAAHRNGLELLMGTPDRSRVVVAETDGEVCGMATVQLVVSTAQGGLSGLVEDVIVAPGTRGCGMGRELMAAVTDWSVSRGASRVQLLADQDNKPALAFYEALGFSETSLKCLRIFPEAMGGTDV